MLKMFRNVISWFIAAKQAFTKSETVLYTTENKERIPVYDRIRGELIINLPECVGCGICVQSCPNNSLKLVPYESKNPKNKRKLAPKVDLGTCSFCGICVDECPYDALAHGNAYDRAYLTLEDMRRGPVKMYEEWIEQRGEPEEDEELELEERRRLISYLFQ